MCCVCCMYPFIFLVFLVAAVNKGLDYILNLFDAGKTTTTAMLSVVLRNLGEDITAIVGAQVPQVFLVITSSIFFKLMSLPIC